MGKLFPGFPLLRSLPVLYFSLTQVFSSDGWRLSTGSLILKSSAMASLKGRPNLQNCLNLTPELLQLL
jgi:hypothetical protein